MHLRGSSSGKGAGCPTFLADSAGNAQTLLVYSKNSSLSKVACLSEIDSADLPMDEKEALWQKAKGKVG